MRYVAKTGVDIYVNSLSNSSKTDIDNNRKSIIRNVAYERIGESPHGHVKFKGEENNNTKERMEEQ